MRFLFINQEGVIIDIKVLVNKDHLIPSKTPLYGACMIPGGLIKVAEFVVHSCKWLIQKISIGSLNLVVFSRVYKMQVLAQ